jgi:polyphosphate kinase
MTRNLNRRIEAGFPIYDPNLFQEIRHIIQLQQNDNIKARNSRNVYLRRSTEPDLRSQYETYNYLKELNPVFEKAPAENEKPNEG